MLERVDGTTYRAPLEISTLELRAESRLPRTRELLLERRRCLLVSAGSFGLRPLALAKRFRISVKETTPDKRPDMCVPGKEDAETEGEAEVAVKEGVA